MVNEMFRFSVIRPFQKKEVSNTRNPVIPSYAPTNNSNFFQQLKKEKDAGNREGMLNLAKNYRMNDTLLKNNMIDVSAPVDRIDTFLLASTRNVGIQQLKDKITEVFKEKGIDDWVSWIKRGNLSSDLGRLHDSLIACTVGIEQDSKVRVFRPRLVRAIRLMSLLQRLANGDKSVSAKGGLDAALKAIVLLPKELLPLPRKDDKDEREDAEKKYEEEKKKNEDRTQHIIQMLKDIERLNNAREQLDRVHAEIALPERLRESNAQFEALESERRKGKGLASGLLGGIGTAKSEFEAKNFVSTSTHWILTPTSVKALSAETMKVLSELGVNEKSTIDIRKVNQDLESRISQISDRLHHSTPKHETVMIGNNFISKAVLAPQPPTGVILVQPGPGSVNVAVPAPVPPQLTRIPTVPAGKGNVQPLGFADLLVVKDELLRYEAGEVADIENILKGEHRKREHKRTTEQEEILTTDTEKVSESERDLQTTDRFQLQDTAQKQVEEKIKAEAGVKATYNGGTYEIKADAGFAYDRAIQQSNSKATSIAHDVTNRTVSKISETIREQRTSRAREIIEETNLHEIENSENPSGHIRGVYRWVNEIHKAEVVNYGRRLMFEFIVPEPAAFFKFADLNSRVEGIAIDKPEPPVYESTMPDPSLSFSFNLDFSKTEIRPLQPEDLTDSTYLHWVAKYNVQDVEPPPPKFKIVSLAISEKPSNSGNDVPKSIGDLSVEEGYRADSAYIGATFIRGKNEGYVRVAVGQRSTELWGGPQDITMNGEDGKVPVTVCFYSISALTLTVEVTCRRTDEKYRSWQLKTFASIINAYDKLKSEYDEQIASAEIQAGVSIQGKNPEKNREVERTELKKMALSVITGQQFDLFDAMQDEVAPHKYPQLDLVEAAAEGRYIQFFEQAFEWAAMSYIFYPYFWGRKAGWINALHSSDPDPKFEEFKQAGAARILVSVRPGYEQAVLNYLETNDGDIWDGGDPPHVSDDLFVSIVDSIKEEQGDWFAEAQGELVVKKGDAIANGIGTVFTEDDDENREIKIRGRTYRVLSVERTDKIQLDRGYEDKDEGGVPFELGLKFVGQPWEVKVPTSLVWLQDSADLPDLERERKKQ